MAWPEPSWAAPVMILRQLTDPPGGAALIGGLLLALVVWICVRRPAWKAVWPMLLTPLPWVVLIIWAASHLAEDGRWTGSQAELWGLLMLCVTAALSIWAVARAERIRAPVAGICLLNGLFAGIAALFAVMLSIGVWM